MTAAGQTEQAPPPLKNSQSPLKDLLELWHLSGENVSKFVELLTREE
jgi:hypothetical protein